MNCFGKTVIIFTFLIVWMPNSYTSEKDVLKEKDDFSWTQILKSSISPKHYFWGLQLLLIAIYESISLISKQPSRNGAQLITPPPSFIQDILTQFAISKPVLFCTADTKSIGSVEHWERMYFIQLSSQFYNESTLEEKRFVIGHELAHIKNHHAPKQALISASIVPLVILSVLAIDKATHTSIDYIKDKLNLDKKAYFSRFLSGIQKGSHILSRSPLFHWLIIKYCNSAYSRSCESEADRDAAMILNCAEGGISFFKKEMLQNTEFSSPLRKVKYHIDEALGFLSHPSDKERISDLQKLTQKAV